MAKFHCLLVKFDVDGATNGPRRGAHRLAWMAQRLDEGGFPHAGIPNDDDPHFVNVN